MSMRSCGLAFATPRASAWRGATTRLLCGCARPQSKGIQTLSTASVCAAPTAGASLGRALTQRRGCTRLLHKDTQTLSARALSHGTVLHLHQHRSALFAAAVHTLKRQCVGECVVPENINTQHTELTVLGRLVSHSPHSACAAAQAKARAEAEARAAAEGKLTTRFLARRLVCCDHPYVETGMGAMMINPLR